MASPVSGSKRRLRPEQFTKGLNPRQLEAVEHGEGPLLVLAGAGSGKTKVLTSRIGYLIASGVVTPDRVLAITFTNKAAREMKVRLGASLGSVAHDMWVSTFHSACVRMHSSKSVARGITTGETPDGGDIDATDWGHGVFRLWGSTSSPFRSQV